MPRGSHAKGGIRSHRRRIGKHLVIAPWVIITAVAALVLAGLTGGYVYLVTRGCDGPTVTATVVTDPDIADIVGQRAQTWSNSGPTVDGHCARISVQQKTSASAAAALAPTWDPRTDGPRPDVWIPESSLWSQLAASRADAARMLPTKQPSLARSPAVIAMPAPMAKAVGGPAPRMTWKDLATRYAGLNWAIYHHPEWGGIKVAVTDPTISTAGLLSMTAMVSGGNSDGGLDSDQRSILNRLWQVRPDQQNDVGTIVQKLTVADGTSATKALHAVSAFPALERDVVDYNSNTPRQPLTAVYPHDGSFDADFPYLVLNWSHADSRQIDQAKQRHRDNVARAFLTFLTNKSSKAQFLAAGYRDANRLPGRQLTPANGVARKVPTLPHHATTPDTISQTVSSWTAISRPANVLLVVDVSDDMGQTVTGDGNTKQFVAGRAAAQAVELFGSNSQARIGLWAYASGLDGDRPYRQLVSVGGINDNLDGTPRGAKISDELTGLDSGGQAGLFDTAAAAYRQMRKDYVDDAVNQIVLITGSGQDTTSSTGLSSLTSDLTGARDKKHPLPIMTVGFGDHIDMSALQSISQATGGRTYATASPGELSKLLLTAMFSGTPPQVT